MLRDCKMKNIGRSPRCVEHFSAAKPDNASFMFLSRANEYVTSD